MALRKDLQFLGYRNNYRRIKKCVKHNGVAGLRHLLPGRVWMDSLDLVITTKCNLRCEGCSNFMPLYKKQYDVDRQMVLDSMERVFACVDWIDRFKVLGGEPFCCKDLKIYLEAIPRHKMGDVRLYTNGSIIPKDPELLDVMRRQRITVWFSNYPAHADTQKKCIEWLKEQGVLTDITPMGDWYDKGDPVDYGRRGKELDVQFRYCNTECKSLLKGVIYFCPRSAHGYDLGLMGQGAPDEYVDLFKGTVAENRRKIRRLVWRRHAVEACKYCKMGTPDCGFIPRGDS